MNSLISRIGDRYFSTSEFDTAPWYRPLLAILFWLLGLSWLAAGFLQLYFSVTE